MKEENENARIVDAALESASSTQSEKVVAEEVGKESKKLKLYRSWKFWGVIVILLAFILGILGIVDVITVYREAIIYKRAYDIVQKEKKYCEEIQGTSQPRDNFVYCDKFNEKFRELESR